MALSSCGTKSMYLFIKYHQTTCQFQKKQPVSKSIIIFEWNYFTKGQQFYIQSGLVTRRNTKLTKNSILENFRSVVRPIHGAVCAWLAPPTLESSTMQYATRAFTLQRRTHGFTLFLCLHAVSANMSSDDYVSCEGIAAAHLLEEDGLYEGGNA